VSWTSPSSFLFLGFPQDQTVVHPSITPETIPRSIPDLLVAIASRLANLLVVMSLFPLEIAIRAAVFTVGCLDQEFLKSSISLKLIYFLPSFPNPIPLLRAMGLRELSTFPVRGNMLTLAYAKGVVFTSADDAGFEETYKTFPKEGEGSRTRVRMDASRDNARKGVEDWVVEELRRDVDELGGRTLQLQQALRSPSLSLLQKVLEHLFQLLTLKVHNLRPCPSLATRP